MLARSIRWPEDIDGLSAFGYNESVALSELVVIAPFSWSGVASALLAGGILGFERQVSGKPVGIRTSALICLGTYVFIVLGGTVEGDHIDRSRVLGQVVTGIGFLGAGVIMARDGTIKGVTSASAIWVLAAVGSAIGMGFEATGVKLAVLAVAILTGVSFLESWLVGLRKGVHDRTRGRGDTSDE